MDHFVPTQLIDKRIGEFSQEAITAEEVNDFYSLERVADADDGIPYGWSSSINSLDGVTSIGDMDAATSVKTIGLKLHPKAQSRPDFRLLSGGWMYADAVIFSGASLRDESNQKLLITIPNFVKYRREVLQKPTDQPDLVIVTASGNIPQQHPIWDTDRRKMIATSAKGAKCISQEWAKEKQIHVETFEGNEDPNSVDLESMLRFLKREWSVKFFDLCSGPRLISSMINKKLLKEYRYTTSGIVIGKSPEWLRGQTFPHDLHRYYDTKDRPILEFVGIRIFGPFHVYHRGKWLYQQ